MKTSSKKHGYIYRAIASNRDELSDREIIHWCNQRGEDSEAWSSLDIKSSGYAY